MTSFKDAEKQIQDAAIVRVAWAAHVITVLRVVLISPPSCIISILPVNMIPSPGNSILSHNTPSPKP